MALLVALARKSALAVVALMLIVPPARSEDIHELTTPEPIIIKGQQLLAYISAYEQLKQDQKHADIRKLTVLMQSSKESTEVVFTFWPDPVMGPDGKYVYPSPAHVSNHGNSVSYVVDNATDKVIKKTYQR